MRTLAVATAISVLSVPVAAQTASPPAPQGFWRGWSGTLENKVAPALGEPIADTFADDYVDQSEYEVSFALKRNLDSFFGAPFELKGGVTAQPHLSDDGAQESAAYAQVTFGDSFVPLNQLIAEGRLRKPKNREDAWRPFVRYRFADVQSGILDKHARDEETVSGGIRWRNVLTVQCDGGRSADVYPCGEDHGWALEVRGELAYLWSSDSSRDRIYPTARADVISPMFWGGVRTVAAVWYERSFYQNERVGVDQELREDERLRIQAGFDISAPVQRLFATGKTITAELLGRFQRNWSDRADREHSRLYFVPSISFRTEF